MEGEATMHDSVAVAAQSTSPVIVATSTTSTDAVATQDKPILNGSHALPSEERATLPESSSTMNTISHEQNQLVTANQGVDEPVKVNSTVQDSAQTTKESNPDGIEPVSNFLPPEPAHSHPTPPPEPPVTSISAIVEPTNANTPPAEPTVESSLNAARTVEPETGSVPAPAIPTATATEAVETTVATDTVVLPPVNEPISAPALEAEPASVTAPVPAPIPASVPALSQSLSISEGREALLNGVTTPVLEEIVTAVPVEPKETTVAPAEQGKPADTAMTTEASVDTVMATEASADTVPAAEPALPAATLPESQPTSLVRQRDDDMEDDEPAAKRSKVEELEVESKPAVVPEIQPASAIDEQGDVSMTDAPAKQEPASVQAPIADAAAVAATPSTIPAPAQTAYFTNAMTDVQKAFLLEKTKNLKKTKHAAAFLVPVDPVKLNIPNYPNIIKNPMDLGTLENKLKADQYASPQAYADDFNQIVTNTKVFNGEAHAVTIAANNMEAYFKKYMTTVPNPEQTAPVKATKKSEPTIARPQPRREARVSQPPPPPPPPQVQQAPTQQAPARTAAVSPSATNQTFALQADGTPQIRRDSTTKRPHRTIKPPQSRELSYAKPKRKEHQLELKFCEHILDQVRGPRYGPANTVFLHPVDPVALNIPHYRQIVKKPMDLTTMTQKLKSGQYGTAKEFRADFDLMIENCLIFNPVGNPVHDLGVEMRRGFENLWKEKEKWERANKKSSERESSASANESEEESEEEEEENTAADQARETIAALTKQLAELQKTVETAAWAKDTKKKSKDGKKSKKNSLSATSKSKSAPSKSKAPKKPKPLSYDDKQEISNAVGQMNEQQVSKLTQIITDNCEKYRNMGDDMELEIDDLPNDVQALLLKHVRSIFGNPNRGARAASPEDIGADDDDDFAPPARDRAAGGAKRKKHKPMGKKEQQENIAELRNRLAAFKNPGESESPRSAQAYGQPADDTSGDEESEESEEE